MPVNCACASAGNPQNMLLILVCPIREQRRSLLTACNAPDWYVVKVTQSHVPPTKHEKEGYVVVEPQQGKVQKRDNTQLCAKHEERPETKRTKKSKGRR